MRDLVILKKSPPTAPSDGDPIEGLEGFVDRGEGEVAAGSPIVDRPHGCEAARMRFGDRMPIEIDALVWLAPGEALPAWLSGAYRESFRLRLRAELGWRPDRADEADADDVVKQVSFLHAAGGYGEERFRPHYRDHVSIARRYMPALWQYVQNDVLEVRGDAPESVGIVAVSELWFRTTDDFLERYFPSEADQRAFSSHEGFLDLTKATSFVCASARLRSEGSAG